ncbi:MAG: PspA/IM30 family protein [Actinomycetaceae bacterium]|nr:PspA/IM30 family protein [Actinomycetaceae bacterium]MDO5747000.1 PspA/IM30 family protein [Actinomycetaceae bacterium]
MAEKVTILGRIKQLVKANINDLIDRAEDPQKMIDQLIRDYTNNIVEAETAVAQEIGSLKMAQKDHETNQQAAIQWGEKARLASTRADEARRQGDSQEADRLDNLAKVALKKQIELEQEVKEQEPLLKARENTAQQLREGLTQMKTKLEELKIKRNQLVARQRSAETQNRVTEAMKTINIMDPTSELSRFEESVRKEEALAQGRAELSADSLEAQFAELEASDDELEIEQRLAQLKSENK